MLYNYHTHTYRCNHAIGTEKEYVEEGIRRGLKILGFSDHAPYLFPDEHYSSWRMQKEELFDYAETVRALAKEYEKDIRILLGFELEYYPDWHENEIKFLKQVSPDYLILGQHCTGNEERGVFSREDPPSKLKDYVSQTLAGLATGDFLYLAHPDLPGYKYDEEEIEREYTRLCIGAKEMNIPLELNLLGVRSGRHYPDERFYKIAKQVGNRIVLGTDAHELRHTVDTPSEEIALHMVEKLGLDLIQTPLL